MTIDGLRDLLADEDPARTGPLIPPRTAAAFDDVVSRALAGAPRPYADVPVSTLRPALGCVTDLLDQAHAVLAGNPVAADRFRELLGSFGAARTPTRTAQRIFESHADGRCRCGDGGPAGRGPSLHSSPVGCLGLLRLRSPRKGDRERVGVEPQSASRMPNDGVTQPPLSFEPLVAMDRLEPVLAAAVYAGRDERELALLVGGIELGLTGMPELNTLFQLALGGAAAPAIGSAFDTVVRTLGLAAFGSGAGARPFPPFGAGTGFGSPGSNPGGRPGFGWPGDWPFPWPFPVPGGGGDRPRPGQVPVRPPPFPRYEFEECVHFEIIPLLHRLGIGFSTLVLGDPARYEIDAVEPDHACPGDPIAISGRNFSGVRTVHFVDVRGRAIPVRPEHATDTRITVMLPESAVSGQVWLDIPVTVHLCRTEQTLARPGTPGHVIVGSPIVVAFGIEGGRRCVTVRSPARLTWAVQPADATIRITRELDGTETVLAEDVSATGDLVVDTGTAGTHRFRIDVENPHSSCGPATASAVLEVREPTPIIEILGVEVTQAIQVFDLANPAAPTNNGVGLIAGMDTVLRVYVRSLTGGNARITGTMECNGIGYRPINRTPTYGASPFIDTPPDPLRVETNHSLNFLIPAADASGDSVSADIRVFTAGHYCGDVEEAWTQVLSWAERPAFPVTIRRIADSDGNVITERDAVILIRNAFRKIPSPITAIALRPGVFQIQRGTTEDNYCRDGGYYQLALSLGYEHNATEGYAPDGHESSWIGIYWQTGCSASGMMAWPWTSTCITSRGEATAAHELMHTVGLGHTVTGREGCEDIGQPVACHRFDHMPTGRLVEVPFDIRNNRAVPSAVDLQSYRLGEKWLCPELWILGRDLMDTRY